MSELNELQTGLRGELTAVADPAKVAPMTAYMKHKFTFLGVTSANRRRASKQLLQRAKVAPADELLDFAAWCWSQPEREFHSVGVDALRAGANGLRSSDLGTVRSFIQTNSWWDTVDSLAAWTVGPMVRNHPQLANEMDVWIDDADIWVARTAILHQLGYKGDTDAERLFRYASTRAEDKEFFIRKAIGWALRQYARQDPDAVRAFVRANDERLSGLTRREAMKHLR